jgi:hypothetical protein
MSSFPPLIAEAEPCLPTLLFRQRIAFGDDGRWSEVPELLPYDRSSAAEIPTPRLTIGFDKSFCPAATTAGFSLS